MRFFLLIVWFTVVTIELPAQARDEFVLVKKDKDISIYERWIKFPKSDPPVDAREVKGEFTFNDNMYEGLRLLQNEYKIEKWQSHVSEFKVYLNEDDTMSWIEYSYHDIPWPVSDQDHILKYTIEETGEEKLMITFESIVDNTRAPVRKGVSRMHLSGSWTFEQVTPDKTKATYRILSTPLNFPKWITDPIIRNNMMTTIKEFIALIESEK